MGVGLLALPAALVELPVECGYLSVEADLVFQVGGVQLKSFLLNLLNYLFLSEILLLLFFEVEQGASGYWFGRGW